MDGKAYFDSGVENYKKGCYTEAIADFDKAIELKPTSSWAHSCRAASYACRGGVMLASIISEEDIDQAISDYSKAIDLGGDSNDYKERGLLYSLKEQDDMSMADYNKAISLDPNNAEAYFARGALHFRRDEYAEAVANFAKTKRLNPSHPSAQDMLDGAARRLSKTV